MTLLSTPPFAPNTLRALQALGIQQLADLQKLGAVHTFLLLKAAGHTFTRSILWQLHAACLQTDVRQLTATDKAALLTALQAHPPVAIFPPMANMMAFMQHALAQAQQAAALGEIPVGAVVVYQNQIIAAAHNACVATCDVSQHAEIRALAQAGAVLGNYRLTECDVYITLEPCMMCAGALLQARVKRVIFGAAEPKMGAAGSVLNVFAQRRFNSHTAIQGGILANECQAVLQQFFQQNRQRISC